MAPGSSVTGAGALTPAPAAPDRWLVPAAATAAAVLTFLLARSTLMPGLGFWDTGEAQVIPPALGTFHPTGFPSYVWLGWLASIVLQPFGDPAFRMNLLSALLAAASAAGAVVLTHQLTRRTLLALAVGIALGAMPVVWRLATHADAHMLHLLLVIVLFGMLLAWERRTRSGAPTRDRWLIGAAIVYGIALGNHTLTLLLAPGVFLFVLVVDPRVFRRPRLLVTIAALLVATVVLLYLELPLRAGIFRGPLVYGNPATLDGFLYVVLAEQFRGALYEPFARLPEKFGDLVTLGIDQLGPLVWLIPFGFLATVLRRPAYALLSGSAFVVTVWFSASYINAEIDRYYLGPGLIALTWIAMLAATAWELLLRAAGAAPHTAAPSPTAASGASSGPRSALAPAALIVEAALAVSLLVPTIQAIPERHDEFDLSRDTAAGRWAHAAMARFEPDAVVVSWWSYSTPLWYVQIIEGQRPDVWIVDDRTRLDQALGEVTDVVDANLGRRPVYLIRLNEDELALLHERYQLEQIDMPIGTGFLRVLGPRG